MFLVIHLRMFLWKKFTFNVNKIYKMATCPTSYFNEETECKHTRRLVSFKLDDTNREIEIDGVHYKFDSVEEKSNRVVYIDDNCRFLYMPLDLFGRLHAIALSGIHEFNVLI